MNVELSDPAEVIRYSGCDDCDERCSCFERGQSEPEISAVRRLRPRLPVAFEIQFPGDRRPALTDNRRDRNRGSGRDRSGCRS